MEIERSIRETIEKIWLWLDSPTKKGLKGYVIGIIGFGTMFLVLDLFQKWLSIVDSSNSLLMQIFWRCIAIVKSLFTIGVLLWWIIIFVIKKRRLRSSFFSKKSAWHSHRKDITIVQYDPPKQPEHILLFRFWYNWSNPRIISAIIYHLVATGSLKIESISKKCLRWLFKTEYYKILKTPPIIKKIKRAKTASLLNENQIQAIYENVEIRNNLTSLEKRILNTLIPNDFVMMRKKIKIAGKTARNIFENIKKRFPAWLYINSSTSFWWKDTLTKLWQDTLEHLYWYKEYLEKVETIVIQQELKNDPNYVNKILPRLILFNIREDLTTIQKNIIKDASVSQISWYYEWEQVLFE